LGLSSALGMMFDHGCDSVALILILWNINLLIGMTIHKMLFVYFCVKFLFLITNYEAALSGGMNLPIINGPSDGGFAITIFFCLPYIFGDKIF
jgi:hypothetical protein